MNPAATFFLGLALGVGGTLFAFCIYAVWVVFVRHDEDTATTTE